MNLSSREVLAKILCDHRESGAAFKQSGPNFRDVAVYKSGFSDGLLGRPGWQLKPIKTVTLKTVASSAASAAVPN